MGVAGARSARASPTSRYAPSRSAASSRDARVDLVEAALERGARLVRRPAWCSARPNSSSSAARSAGVARQRDRGLEVRDRLRPARHGLGLAELGHHRGAVALRRRLAQRTVEVVDGRRRDALRQRAPGRRAQDRHDDRRRPPGERVQQMGARPARPRHRSAASSAAARRWVRAAFGERQLPIDGGAHERMGEAQRIARAQDVRALELARRRASASSGASSASAAASCSGASSSKTATARASACAAGGSAPRRRCTDRRSERAASSAAAARPPRRPGRRAARSRRAARGRAAGCRRSARSSAGRSPHPRRAGGGGPARRPRPDRAAPARARARGVRRQLRERPAVALRPGAWRPTRRSAGRSGGQQVDEVAQRGRRRPSGRRRPMSSSGARSASCDVSR